jgi:choice-of-anchor C domain-containing protein
MHPCKVVCVLITALALSASASAQNLLINGSFEIGPVGACNTFNIPAGSQFIPGWTVSVGNVDWETGPPCGWQVRKNAKGNKNSIDLVGAGAGGIGGIEQTFTTTPGATYRVAFDLAGNYGGNPPVIKPLQVTVAGVTRDYLFDTTGRSQFHMGWKRHRFFFVANSTSATLKFVSDVSAAGGPNDAGAVIDNVTVILVSP